MPSERSIFRKIQVVLDYCQQHKHTSINNLIEIIRKKSPVNFVYHSTDPDSDEIISKASEKSIKKTVNVCIDLSLIDAQSGSLTRLGISATDPRRFSRIVGNQALRILSDQGITLEKIESNINNNILHKNPPSLPTALHIWEVLKSDISLHEFSMLINILGYTEILSVSQKKIYMPTR